MEILVFLSIVIAVVAVLTSIVLVQRVKKQIAEMADVLVDVKNGNGNRRILSATNELTAPLAYEINEIVVAYESRLSTVRQTEETNRQLMTSLSHDVRTPLTNKLLPFHALNIFSVKNPVICDSYLQMVLSLKGQFP